MSAEEPNGAELLTVEGGAIFSVSPQSLTASDLPSMSSTVPSGLPGASKNATRLLVPRPPKPARALLVYLPGMDGTGSLLDPQIDRLARCFDLRCLVLPAAPGDDWQTLTAQTVALLRREQQAAPRPIVLCGESFGGCLALAVARAAPQLCDRLILINPATSFRERPYLKLVTAVAPWVPVGGYEVLAGLFLPFLLGDRRVEPGVSAALLRAMQSVLPETVYWRLQLLESFRFPLLALRRLQQPTLLIAGEADRLLPSVAEVSRLAAALPCARTVLLPASGHTCLLEAETCLLEILRSQDFVFESTERLQKNGDMR